MNRPWRILLVDDDPDFIHAARRILRRSRRIRAELQTTHRADEAMAIVGSKPVDMVMADYRLPSSDGAQLLERVKAARPEVTSVLVSGYDGEYLQRLGVHEGQVDHFVAKDELLRELDRKLAEFLGADHR